jgi:hypothetical protein
MCRQSCGAALRRDIHFLLALTAANRLPSTSVVNLQYSDIRIPMSSFKVPKPLGTVPLELATVRRSQVLPPAIMGNRHATCYFAGIAVPNYKKRPVETQTTVHGVHPNQSKEK